MFVILFGVFGGLIAGLVLSQFGADEMLINVLQPFLSEVELTTQHYYVAFGLLGLFLGIISFLKTK
ncbi:MAG: hypothetical protein FWC76_04895 [Defluviitaleaceae bacterium]|nr:hypothetical protein [Defluviitaleaceae bacterium]